MVNVPLVAVLVGVVCWAAIIRLSPGEMRRMADWLNARADAESWFAIRRQEYRQHREDGEACLKSGQNG